MTRRSSVRAQARRIYRDPPSQSFGGASPPSPGSSAVSLTERVRALYEDSAVPVRDIAALAGVTERTIYKYAAKHNWKPRYRWAPNRSWRAGAAFAPVKGASARFIRRDDKDKPFATGLKATDPAASARATAQCEEAGRAARLAQEKAEAAQRFEARLRAIEWTNNALKELRECREAHHEKAGPFNDRVERILTQVVTVALSRWEALQK